MSTQKINEIHAHIYQLKVLGNLIELAEHATVDNTLDEGTLCNAGQEIVRRAEAIEALLASAEGVDHE